MLFWAGCPFFDSESLWNHLLQPCGREVQIWNQEILGKLLWQVTLQNCFFSAIVFHLYSLLHFSNMLMSTSSFEPCYKPLKHREQISNSHVMLMKLLPREVNLTILAPCRWLMTKLRLEPNASYHTPLRSQPQTAISPDHGLLLCVIFRFLKVKAHLCDCIELAAFFLFLF